MFDDAAVLLFVFCCFFAFYIFSFLYITKNIENYDCFVRDMYSIQCAFGNKKNNKKRKPSDWKHHKLAWFITTQDRKALQQLIQTTRTSLVPSTEHQ